MGEEEKKAEGINPDLADKINEQATGESPETGTDMETDPATTPGVPAEEDKPTAEVIDESVKEEQAKEEVAGAVARQTLANTYPQVIEQAKALAATHGGRGAEMICSLLLRS